MLQTPPARELDTERETAWAFGAKVPFINVTIARQMHKAKMMIDVLICYFSIVTPTFSKMLLIKRREGSSVQRIPE